MGSMYQVATCPLMNRWNSRYLEGDQFDTFGSLLLFFGCRVLLSICIGASGDIP